MEAIKSTVNSITDLMERDNRGVQIGCYSVALVGLTIAIRRVRPFSRFKRPSDIPNHFIKERRELTGLVERIEPNGGLLMINHRPLVPLPIIPEGQLPVKISGVNVGGLGVSWLQTIVAGNEVKFVPISKEKDCVQCEVRLPQLTHDKKQRIVNVGESLVRIGFGQVVDVDKQLVDDRTYLTYQNRLHQAENYALRKKMGVKYYIKPTKNAVSVVIKQLGHIVQTTGKQIARVPKYATS